MKTPFWKIKFHNRPAEFLWIQILLIVMCLCLGSLSTFAQERVLSLKQRQYEIEESINNVLRHYLKPQDYVLKVMLQGDQSGQGFFPESTLEEISPITEELPGFSNPPELQSATKQKIMKDPFLEVTQVRVDLILHKEISPSVSMYIIEIIPLLSGLDPQRGDQFNFIPIRPNEPFPIGAETIGGIDSEIALPAEQGIETPDSEKAIEATEEQEKAIEESLISEEVATDFADTLSSFTPQEWIFLAILLLLIIFFLFVLIFLFKIQRSAQELIKKNKEPSVESNLLSQQIPLEKIEESRKSLLEKQEQQVGEIVLSEENSRLLNEIIKQLVGREDWIQDFVQEMSKNKESSESFTKLIAMMGPETARRLFVKPMGHATYLELEHEANQLTPTPEEINTILKNIRTYLLTQHLVSPESSEADPFVFLKNLSANQIGFLVKDEPIKIKAIVISRLKSEMAAEIMTKLNRNDQTKLMVQLGHMEELPLDLVEQVAYTLARKAQRVPDDNTVSVNGLELIVDVLDDSNQNTRKNLINGLRASDQKLSKQVESLSFVFESIPVVPQDVLTEVVRRMTSDDVITAISTASTKIQRAVILCFPERNRQAIIAAMKARHATLEDIRARRKTFVRAMRQMAEAEKVDLRKVNEAYEGSV